MLKSQEIALAEVKNSKLSKENFPGPNKKHDYVLTSVATMKNSSRSPSRSLFFLNLHPCLAIILLSLSNALIKLVKHFVQT